MIVVEFKERLNKMRVEIIGVGGNVLGMRLLVFDKL